MKNKKNVLKLLFSVGIIAILFYSCGMVPKLRTVDTGYIATPGVEIRGQEHSFVLKHGETWKPPFQSSSVLRKQFALKDDELAGQYDYALEELNAQKVIVKTPYLEKELYGVLSLNQVMEDKGPVTRSYQITIPEEYVQQALNGQVSVLFEYYRFNELNMDRRVPTWILWLSDVPF